MEYGAGLVTAGDSSAATVDRRQRRYHRQKVHSLAYVSVDQGNGGIVRDVTEAGIAIQAVVRLHTDQQVFLRFELLNPRLRIEATGRVAWGDSSGQAGIEFLALPQRSRRSLRDWIFGHVLATVEQVTQSSIFGQNGGAREPFFSPSGRAPIRLRPAALKFGLPETGASRSLQFLASRFVPTYIFSGMADATVILLAVLLFFLLSALAAHALPAWPMVLFLALSVAGIFGALYCYLFRTWTGATPGVHLTRLIIKHWQDTDLQEEDRPRFR
jgi:PilZ domain